MTGSWTYSFCSSVRIQIHGLSGYLLLQFWSYSFNIVQDVYTRNGGVHVHRILIFFKYSQNDRQLDFFSYQLHKGNMVCPVNPSSSFRASALIFFRMFIVLYTHNGGVHVHGILIFIKYSQNDRQLDLLILFVRPDIDTWFWSYSFNILQDVYTHNGDVHVHRIWMVRRGHYLCLTDTLHFFLNHS